MLTYPLLDQLLIKDTVLSCCQASPSCKTFFSLLCIQAAISTYYTVEYSIQETTCTKATEEVTAEKCPPLKCEFAVSHDGFFFTLLFRLVKKRQSGPSFNLVSQLNTRPLLSSPVSLLLCAQFSCFELVFSLKLFERSNN